MSTAIESSHGWLLAAAPGSRCPSPHDGHDTNGYMNPRVIHDSWVLSDEVLLRICCVSPETEHVSAEWLARLRWVSALSGHAQLGPGSRLREAMVLLTSLLEQLPPHHISHPSHECDAPNMYSVGWIKRDALEQVGKQIVGLIWRDASAESVAVAVERAVFDCARLGFLEQRQYDAWRPGMRSGTGWRWAIRVTPYGIARAVALTVDTSSQRSANRCSADDVTSAEKDTIHVMIESNEPDDQGVGECPLPSGSKGLKKEQYRQRLVDLLKQRCPPADGSPTENSADVRQVAGRLADELAVWVEAISDAEADRHPTGGYWTVLGDDLREMLGPSELTTGVFDDDWTPLLTQLRMNGLADLAQALDRLVEEAIPLAQQLARDMDAVAYVRSGGPRDAFYELYVRDELSTHEACAHQGREDVSRVVMRIVGMLRTLTKADLGSAAWVTRSPKRSPKPQPRRGTRTANIEKLEKELEKHLLAARDHAHSQRDRGREPALLPRPSQKELASRAGLSEADVSRCINDKRATVLKILWETAVSLESVMVYKRRR